MGRLAAALLDDGELVAAEAGDQLVAADHRAQPVGDLDQQLVAGRMAVNVVDRLEAVEVDAEDGERLAGVGGAGDGAGEMVVEHRPVGQAGQRVVIGEVGDPRRRFLALGDVADGEHLPLRAAPVQRAQQHLDVAFAAGGAGQPAFGGARRRRAGRGRAAGRRARSAALRGSS